MTEEFIKELIEAGAIPKKNLIDGDYYYGECRNAEIAKWNQKKNCFTYTRYKFNDKFSENINHFEDDDGYDLFVPIKVIIPKVDEIISD